MSSDRERIGQAILNLCDGERFDLAFLAQIDALATSIGGVHRLSGKTVTEAEAAARAAGEMLLQHVRKNWGQIEVAH